MFIGTDFKLPFDKQLESRIGYYIYVGINDDIINFEEKTKYLTEQEKQQALVLLERLIEYYSEKYILSSRYLIDEYKKLKFNLEDKNV